MVAIANLIQQAAPAENTVSSGGTSYDLLEYARKRAERYNQTVGGLTGKDCALCRNKGQIMVAREDGSNVIQECKCMSFRKSLRRLERSGLQNLVGQCTFDRYQVTEAWQRSAKEAAQEYAREPGGRWFLAAGQPGSGKTHLCVAICRELMLRGLEARYMLWRDEVPGIKAAVNDTAEYQRLVEPLKRVPVLYIDDFFKTGRGERPTVGDVNAAFEILNARYINRDLVTVISTERLLPDLLEIDEAVGSRIYERSKTSNIMISGIEKNWRLNH